MLPAGAAEREGVQPGGEREEHQDRGDPGTSQTAEEHRSCHQRRNAGQSVSVNQSDIGKVAEKISLRSSVHSLGQVRPT